MLLKDFIDLYVSTRDLAPATVAQLHYARIALEKHLLRPAVAADLEAGCLNRWICARLAEGLSRKTVQVQRAAILTLRREAARQNLIVATGDVRTVRTSPSIPRAWLPDELAKLLQEASRVRGAFECGVPRNLMLRALFLTSYYSGLRISDTLSLESFAVMSHARVIVCQEKTKVPISIELPQDAIDAIAATYPERRELLFPLRRKQVAAWLVILRTRLGIQGSAKWFRRTGATRCEQVQPGSAMAYLGHKTPGLAYKHYVDMRQIAAQRPVPPPPTAA
jgi:integrase